MHDVGVLGRDARGLAGPGVADVLELADERRHEAGRRHVEEREDAHGGRVDREASEDPEVREPRRARVDAGGDAAGEVDRRIDAVRRALEPVAVQVDQPGRDEQPGDILDRIVRARLERPGFRDGGDPPVVDGDVAQRIDRVRGIQDPSAAAGSSASPAHLRGSRGCRTIRPLTGRKRRVRGRVDAGLRGAGRQDGHQRTRQRDARRRHAHGSGRARGDGRGRAVVRADRRSGGGRIRAHRGSDRRGGGLRDVRRRRGAHPGHGGDPRGPRPRSHRPAAADRRPSRRDARAARPSQWLRPPRPGCGRAAGGGRRHRRRDGRRARDGDRRGHRGRVLPGRRGAGRAAPRRHDRGRPSARAARPGRRLRQPATALEPPAVHRRRRRPRRVQRREDDPGPAGVRVPGRARRPHPVRRTAAPGPGRAADHVVGTLAPRDRRAHRASRVMASAGR